MIKWSFGKKKKDEWEKILACPKCGFVPKQLPFFKTPMPLTTEIKCSKCGAVYDYSKTMLERLKFTDKDRKKLELSNEEKTEIKKMKKTILKFIRMGLPIANFDVLKGKSREINEPWNRPSTTYVVKIATEETNECFVIHPKNDKDLQKQLKKFLEVINKGQKLIDYLDEYRKKLEDEYFI